VSPVARPAALEGAPGPRGRRGPAAWAVSLVVVLALTIGTVGTMARAETPVLPREAVEQMIRDYLLSHPEVILESLHRAQHREREAARAQSRAAVQSHRQALLQDPESPVGGNAAGDVTIVEFFDYRCPHCRRMAPVIKALLAEDRGVRLVYKEMPLLGAESVVAARAALAARRQGKYAEAHDRLMAEAGPFTDATVVTILSEVGVDQDRLRADMNAPETATVLERELALARAIGIDGTPAFVVGGELVVGAIDLGTLRDLVGKARRPP
jgi:protein-disulfide isomerase